MHKYLESLSHKQYLNTLQRKLAVAILFWVIFDLLGAVAFYAIEKETQPLTYVDAAYFTTVTLLTIGYGDITPKSTVGKLFMMGYAMVGVALSTYIILGFGRYLVSSSIGNLRKTNGVDFPAAVNAKTLNSLGKSYPQAVLDKVIN